MSTAAITTSNQADTYTLKNVSVGPKSFSIAGMVCLAAAVLLAAFADNWERLAHAYLLGLTFCLSISLGALFFVVLQHLTNAKWSVVVRRVAELLAAPMPLLGLLFLPVVLPMFLGSGHLYQWNDAEIVAQDPLIQHKTAFLNTPFFAVRCLLYFSVWTWMSRFFLRNAIAQDDGSGLATARMKRYSGPAMILYALTVNFAAFDVLMSLDPHWFSTIYGVYFFGGCAVALFATLPLVLMFLQSRGVLNEEVTVEHFHDLGKLLFGFVFFWSYIAFSQYLLIWYANIPEETGWFAVRQSHGWQIVSLVLILGHFALPFAALMSRKARRSRSFLLASCVFLLGMHAVDLYWLIGPQVSPRNAMPTFIDLLCLIGVLLVWLAATLTVLLRHRLLSTGDPCLQESLAFHNT